jgi:hypothetical protein
VARPVYAPALVAWVGGPHVSIGVSVGSGPPIGWFPLGPREVYVPWYGVSPRYVQVVNQAHVTQVVNVTQIVHSPGVVVAQTPYVHRHFEPGVTVVPGSVLTRRQPVAPIAAQWRELPGVRDLIRDPHRGGPVLADPGLSGLTPRGPGYVAGRPPPIRAEVPPPPARMHIPERVPAPVARAVEPSSPVAGRTMPRPGSWPDGRAAGPDAGRPDRGWPPASPAAPGFERPRSQPVTPPAVGVSGYGAPGTWLPRQPRAPAPDADAVGGAAARIGRDTPPPVGRPPAWASPREFGGPGPGVRDRGGDSPLLTPGRPPVMGADARVMSPVPPPPVRAEPPARVAPPPRMGRPDDAPQPGPGGRPGDRRELAR